MNDYEDYQDEFVRIPEETDEEYVQRNFWDKVKQFAAKVPFIPDAVAMYFVMLDTKTPIWAKVTIVAALAYFILPIDAIPDFIPVVGFADDAGAIAAALAAVTKVMTDEHRQKAKEALDMQ